MRKCLVYILQHVRTFKTKNGLCMKISWKGQNQKDKKKQKKKMTVIKQEKMKEK